MKIYYAEHLSDVPIECERGNIDVVLMEEFESLLREVIPYVDHHFKCHYYRSMDIVDCNCGFERKREKLDAIANRQPWPPAKELPSHAD